MGLFSSSSKSNSSSSTVNQDNRSVADAEAQSATAGGVNVKDNAVNRPIVVSGGSGKNIATNVALTVIESDHKAISRAFDFGDSALTKAINFVETSNQANQETIKDVLGVADGLFEQALEQNNSVLDKAIGTVNTTANKLSQAYEDAQGGNLMIQRIALGVLATVAAVAFFITRKKQA